MHDTDIQEWEYCIILDVAQHPVTGDWRYHNPALNVLEEVRSKTSISVRVLAAFIQDRLPFDSIYWNPYGSGAGLLHAGI